MSRRRVGRDLPTPVVGPQLAGSWTVPRARTATLRRIEKAARLWAEVSSLWEDIDQTLVSQAEEEINQLRAKYRELVEYFAEQGDVS